MAAIGWPQGGEALFAMPAGDVCQGYHTHQPPK